MDERAGLFFTVKKPETNRRRLKRWQRQKWTLSFSDVRGGKAGRLAISMARQHSSKSKATDDVIHSSAAKGRQWQPAARTAAAQTERDNWSSIYSLPVSPYTCIEVGGGAGQLESNDGSQDSLRSRTGQPIIPVRQQSTQCCNLYYIDALDTKFYAENINSCTVGDVSSCTV